MKNTQSRKGKEVIEKGSKWKVLRGLSFYRRKTSWPPEEYVSPASLRLLDYHGAAPPKQAWRRKLNSRANILIEFSVTFLEALKMLGLGIRLWFYVRKEACFGRTTPIDPFTKEDTKPTASLGVPLGGMGSGSIIRGFRGEFRQWQIIPGVCEPAPVMPNQFSIFISREGGAKSYSSVLACGQQEELNRSGDHGLSSWAWNLSGKSSSYHALFPRAWTVYDGEPDPDLKVSCRQISPFMPHNYQDSCLPTAVFVYTLVNTGKERAKVSLLLTWANSIGKTSHHTDHHVNEPFVGEDGVSGVLLHHKTKDDPPVTFAIAACETQNVNVTVLPWFGLSKNSKVTAKDAWDKMTQEGQFERKNFYAGKSRPSSPGETLCAAVSVSTWVEAGGISTFAFAIAWSSPEVKFLKGSSYYRRFTNFFGRSQRVAEKLVHHALTNYKRWEEEIEKWQTPTLEDERLPEWYKFTVFNELYYLVAGGSVWIDWPSSTQNLMDDQQQRWKIDGNRLKHDEESSSVVPYKENHRTSNVVEHETNGNDDDNVGRFIYLEGVEYIMWCTYDVHFYASFALLALFPKIELSIQREFAKAVMIQDNTRVRFLAEGNIGVRKVRGAVPHDLGTHNPWNELNAYNIHDTSRWKDLNPKFVLQVYRDFAITGNMAFALEVWPSVRAAMEYMEQFDRNNDGLVENDGFPDQTYDTWTANGVSAYCGCLWIAALQAAAAMGFRLGDVEFAKKCKVNFLKARHVFESKLWNGSYFNYDSSHNKSIQTDQLAGQWYTASAGLTDLFNKDKIQTTLKKIYDFNVMKTKGGKMGAVNGMFPDGIVDNSCMQSHEIWTGVTYGAAATMILAGMEEQGFATAEGIFSAGWSADGFGYWFQTPEAWTIDGRYRSLQYMRPLAIWGMQWALSGPRVVLQAQGKSVIDSIDIPPITFRVVSFEEGATRAGEEETERKACFGKCYLYSCAC